VLSIVVKTTCGVVGALEAEITAVLSELALDLGVSERHPNARILSARGEEPTQRSRRALERGEGASQQSSSAAQQPGRGSRSQCIHRQ
jgi:hypothetical protein